MKKLFIIIAMLFVVGCSAESEPETILSSDQASPQEVQSSSENPWMLQERCVEHPDDCTKYDVYNQTDSWLQVDLKNTETGDTGFFTIQSKTTG